jgi:hypothetical protein
VKKSLSSSFLPGGEMKSDAWLDDDYEKDDKEDDYIPATKAAVNKVMEGKGKWEDNHLTKQHHKAFYLEVFPPVNPHE